MFSVGKQYLIQSCSAHRQLYAKEGKDGNSGFGTVSFAQRGADTQWIFEDVGAGHFRIVNCASGRALYAHVGKSSSQGVGAHTRYREILDQQWRLERLITNVASGRCSGWLITNVASGRCLHMSSRQGFLGGFGISKVLGEFFVAADAGNADTSEYMWDITQVPTSQDGLAAPASASDLSQTNAERTSLQQSQRLASGGSREEIAALIARGTQQAFAAIGAGQHETTIDTPVGESLKLTAFDGIASAHFGSDDFGWEDVTLHILRPLLSGEAVLATGASLGIAEPDSLEGASTKTLRVKHTPGGRFELELADPLVDQQPHMFEVLAPDLFKATRDAMSVDNLEYWASISSLVPPVESCAAGAVTGDMSFTTQDGRFLAMVCTNDELSTLIGMLPEYAEYLRHHPDSFLTRYFGAYRLSFPLGAVVHIVVVNNVFAGAQLAAKYSFRNFSNFAGCGENEVEEAVTLFMNDDICQSMHGVLAYDTAFLEGRSIFNYSLMAGTIRLGSDAASPGKLALLPIGSVPCRELFSEECSGVTVAHAKRVARRDSHPVPDDEQSNCFLLVGITGMLKATHAAQKGARIGKRDVLHRLILSKGGDIWDKPSGGSVVGRLTMGAVVRFLDVGKSGHGNAAARIEQPMAGWVITHGDDGRPLFQQQEGVSAEDAPGMYHSLAKLRVGDALALGGTEVGVVDADTVFEVLEVVALEDKQRIRGRIAMPAGWVSLVNTATWSRMAVHKVELAPDYHMNAGATKASSHYASRFRAHIRGKIKSMSELVSVEAEDFLRLLHFAEWQLTAGAPEIQIVYVSFLISAGRGASDVETTVRFAKAFLNVEGPHCDDLRRALEGLLRAASKVEDVDRGVSAWSADDDADDADSSDDAADADDVAVGGFQSVASKAASVASSAGSRVASFAASKAASKVASLTRTMTAHHHVKSGSRVLPIEPRRAAHRSQAHQLSACRGILEREALAGLQRSWSSYTLDGPSELFDEALFVVPAIAEKAKQLVQPSLQRTNTSSLVRNMSDNSDLAIDRASEAITAAYSEDDIRAYDRAAPGVLDVSGASDAPAIPLGRHSSTEDTIHRLIRVVPAIFQALSLGARALERLERRLPELHGGAAEDHHFVEHRQLRIPRGGCCYAPDPGHEDLRVTTVGANLFDALRQKIGLGDEALLAELGDPAKPLRNFATNSKSGEMFLVSASDQFIVKTISEGEAHALEEFLPVYIDHLLRSDVSLLGQYVGLFVLEPIHKGVRQYVTIMRSVFSTPKEITAIYDLKGSTDGRTAGEAAKVRKDKDWISDGRRLRLSEREAEKFREIHEGDVALLASANMIDYSLLVGIADLGGADCDAGVQRWDSEDGSEHYFVGIIDFLMAYGVMKMAESMLHHLRGKGLTASVTDPATYAQRQQVFLANLVLPAP